MRVLNELITKEDAINAVNRYRTSIMDTKRAIYALPSAQQWIPCSERLPETIGEYLITALSRPSRNAIVSSGYWNERLEEFGTFRQDGTWEKWDVVAWKPLPKPYKVKSEE